MTGMTAERYEASAKWTASEVLSRVVTVTEWPDVYLLLVASMRFKDNMVFVDSLIGQLSNSSQRPIGLTSRLIVWERVTSGDILFEGKGIQISDDLFKVAGRANWLLRNLTGKNFGIVQIHHTSDSLQTLKEKWTAWRQGVDVGEYISPYETSAKGLHEIKSLEALEALVSSLKSSDLKNKLTYDCLERLYQISELPADPSSPANYCSPDTYSYMYLRSLTGIAKKESHEWWTKWWAENKDKLVWNKKYGTFEIKK